MMAEYSKKFIALDLETTHLDVKEGRIMEVGATEADLFFDEKEKQVKVRFGKTFDKLVNPEIEPSQTALSLTGIHREDLKQAPLWRDVKRDLEKFLKDKILLGQNIFFDLGYLKNQNLHLKNSYVDTLELAQLFLPFFPAHSLEYLAQELGGSGQAAHRALSDSQSTALVLAGIINEFLTFDQKLQTDVKDYLERSTLPYRDLFLDLFIPSPSSPTKGGEIKGERNPSSILPSKGEEVTLGDWPDETILGLPLGFGYTQELLNSLAKAKHPGIVGISHPAFLESLPKAQVIADPDFVLCTKRFERVKTLDRLANPALKILIKITIFRHVRKTLDLSGIKWGEKERVILHTVLVTAQVCAFHQCEYWILLRSLKKNPYLMTLSALFKLAWHWGLDFSNRQLLLFDLSRLEEEFIESLTATWNLKTISKEINRLYPTGQQNISVSNFVPKEIEELSLELDMFFGVLHLIYLKREGEYSENLVVDEAERDGERMKKLFYPAEKLKTKIEKGMVYLEAGSDSFSPSEEIKNLYKTLEEFKIFINRFFLEPDPSQIYWLKFGSAWVDLNAVTADPKSSWRNFQKNFKTLTIVDAEFPKISLSYFQKRLGIENFEKQKFAARAPTSELEIRTSSKPLSQNDIFLRIADLPGRTVVVLPNESKLLEYYEFFSHDENFKKEMLSHRYSGHPQLLRTKIEKMGKDALLLLTLNALLKNFQTLPAFRNLVVTRLPFEAPGLRPDILHDPQRNQFLDHALPRSVGLLHLLLTRFAANPEKQKTVYLLDSRIYTDYDQTFFKYLEELPNTEISTV